MSTDDEEWIEDESPFRDGYGAAIRESLRHHPVYGPDALERYQQFKASDDRWHQDGKVARFIKERYDAERS